MATEKMVDGDFLGKLLAGSFEVSMGAVEEAVVDQAELFGATEDSKIKVIGTYSDHAIVVNQDGEFYRCEWSMDGDDVQIKNVRQIDVPVVEAETEIRQSTIREHYNQAVDALLECKTDEAEEKLKTLLDLVNGGVPMTAEAVEHNFNENRTNFTESDWIKMVTEREASIRQFLGADALRLSYPRPKFESLVGDKIDESVAEGKRSQVVGALEEVRAFLGRLHGQLRLARQVEDTYVSRDGSASADGSAADFVQFASGLAEDLDGMISIVDDAMAVSEDGCAKCLARLHDGIVGQMREWALASAFAEKLARRFEAPKAA